jgi:hypothetical protein
MAETFLRQLMVITPRLLRQFSQYGNPDTVHVRANDTEMHHTFRSIRIGELFDLSDRFFVVHAGSFRGADAGNGILLKLSSGCFHIIQRTAMGCPQAVVFSGSKNVDFGCGILYVL